MPFPILFSLTRFAPRMHKQEGDVLAFGEDAVVVIKRGEELHRFLYSDLQRLRYFHFPVTFSRTFQFMSGGLFQKREARFRIKINDRWHEFWLETDLEFRTAELTELFGELYSKGVKLEEYSHSGVRLFLLEGMGQEEIDKRLAELRGEE